MDQQELKNVLEMHCRWVMGEDDGARANLSYADLRSADLSSANLSSANLSSANLSYANLSSADLSSANLSYADLSSANLSYANLSYADLSSANLSSADLSSANLSSADLRSADLSYADLSYADLSYANLRSADLSSADLSSADLKDIKEDFFKRLLLAKKEAIGLYDFLIRGKINGTAYEGECACFCGSIAKIAGEGFKELSSGLKPDYNSPTEKWFLAIKQGDTPHNNSVSLVTKDWMEEFMRDEGLIIPKYSLFSDLERPDLFDISKDES